ncbi:hypothetical protein ENSA5_09940 [Enhygromyxa salina]|uniref:EGF-like domain-containing protein n=1 Tax=Enhygromyxa salina TaxID=215803 RepID=A0A2S9YGH5_9BACT|nr:hypothetical protein [Enhygromyxa salina]PRQ04210.1 hypothetical protein ENSA5_09940 [Enhygromyxa salina]
MRSTVKYLLLLGGLLTGAACGSLGEALDGEECFSDADCGPLNCVQSQPVIDNIAVNSTGIGWCLDRSSCIVGEQPYCACGVDPNTNGPLCSTPYSSNNMVQGTVACWDGVDMATCVCLPPMTECPYMQDDP